MGAGEGGEKNWRTDQLPAHRLSRLIEVVGYRTALQSDQAFEMRLIMLAALRKVFTS